MRNKGFFWSITIALALACIYQLSFTWATSRVESKAVDYAQAKLDSLTQFSVPFLILGEDTLEVGNPKAQESIIQNYTSEYLKNIANEVVHLGFTYAECKGNELNLGLDLKGGMSATLEISVPDLVSELGGNTRSQKFRVPFDKALIRTNEGKGDFINLFVEEFEIANPGEPMAKIFHMYNPDDVSSNASNKDVAKFLTNSANNALDGVEIIIEKRVNTFGVSQPTIQKQPGSHRVFVELPGVKDKESVRRKLQATANLEFYEIYDNAQAGISGILAESEEALGEALFGPEKKKDTVVTTDSDSTALAENSLLSNPEADADLLTDLSTEDDTELSKDLSPEQIGRKAPLSSVMRLAFQYDESGVPVGYVQGSVVGTAAVTDTSTINARIKHPIVKALLPKDLVFMWDAKEFVDSKGLPLGIVNLHAIKIPANGPRVSGKDIDKATVDNSEIGKFAVGMVMTETGASKWESMTEDNLKKQVAITMDGLVFSAPVVQEKMKYRSSITGNFDLYEARDLAGLLNAGSLPAPVKIVDESVVGASIGEANITAGLWSFIFALLVVLVYMVFYYSKAGLVAAAGLVINIFLLIGALASLKAILTLPGIAGIVLTIGMSVDANVLIFERIREELRGGKGLKAAVQEGYAKALSAILDANITTLLTGVVLLIFGTGPITGFATTLIIGIFTSFFAAVVITRLILTAFVEKDRKISFSTKITHNWFTKMSIDFVKKRKLFYLISGAMIIGGGISLATRGLDLGVDFAGGRQYKVEYAENEIDYVGLKTALTDVFEGDQPEVKMVDNKYTALITTKYRITEADTETNNEVETILRKALSNYGEFEIEEAKMIAPTISKDLRNNSFYAVGFSLLIIFVYIVFRFRKWQYGLGALIALLHDVILVLSVYSIFYGWIGFSMEMDQAFIAAILTVVGYSINDTVVVFDRIREYLGLYPKKKRKDIINMALNSTLGRTVNTSISTFIVLLIIFLFGGTAIKGFVFALMIGVVIGTYSSLFIATPLVVEFTRKKDDNE